MAQKRKVYSVEVKDAPEVEGEGKPRRFFGTPDALVTSGPENVKTLFENFKNGVKIAGQKPCLGYRPINDKGEAEPFVWENYDQVMQKVLQLGSAISFMGMKKGDCVGIFSVNRPEWLITDLACNAFGYTSVPLYDTLGDEAIEHIVGQTQLGLIVSSNDKFPILLASKPRMKSVRTIILMGAATQEDKSKGSSMEVDVVGFKEALERGAQSPADPVPTDENEVVTIMYTSGTTGLPKGAMLSSKNFLVSCGSLEVMGKLGVFPHFNKDDVHLSYLPLAHVFERLVVTTLIGLGASVAFFQGTALKLLDDISALRPTLFPSVPRLLNRIHDKVYAAVDAKGGLSRALFYKGVASKTFGLQQGKLEHWLWDKLVFSKVKQRLGGNVRVIISGSAPISPEVLSFLRLAFACEVIEGYGQTEACGASSITAIGDYETGHVGYPLPSNEIKLVDIPEMNYTSKDQPHPRGEICVRGSNVFLGYFKDEEKTKEAIDEKGWLHSGDIGLWDDKGRLKIIDRKKNIFKLAQGEYIAPEKIENVYTKSKWVAQSFVHGDSLKAFLVAIIIPDEDAMQAYAKENNLTGSYADLVKTPGLKDLILKDILKIGKELGLKPFEQVKDIIISSEVFTVENGLLTPSFKLKRPQAKQHFEKEINDLIEKIQKAEEEKEREKNIAEEKKA